MSRKTHNAYMTGHADGYCGRPAKNCAKWDKPCSAAYAKGYKEGKADGNAAHNKWFARLV